MGDHEAVDHRPSQQPEDTYGAAKQNVLRVSLCLVCSSFRGVVEDAPGLLACLGSLSAPKDVGVRPQVKATATSSYGRSRRAKKSRRTSTHLVKYGIQALKLPVGAEAERGGCCEGRARTTRAVCVVFDSLSL